MVGGSPKDEFLKDEDDACGKSACSRANTF